MNDHSLIDKLVNDKYNPRHIIDQVPPLDLALEDLVKALVDAVQNLAENDLIVFFLTKHEDTHILVAPEYCNIVIHCHDIVFIGGDR